MNTLSITTTKTMSYDQTRALQGFAVVERLMSVTGALLQARRSIRFTSIVPALRAAQA